MKKLNGILVAVATAVGLSVVAVAGAQMQPEAAAANSNQYDCPMYNYNCPMYNYNCPMYNYNGGGQGQHRGMRGNHRGWNGYANHRGVMGYMRGGRAHAGFGSYAPRDYIVSLVTPAEMAAYQDGIRTATTVEACQTVYTAHRKLVGERAAAMNVQVPQPRVDVCVEMERNGWYSR